MDFNKIKTAVDEIKLSDSFKEEIINSCSGKKRKFNYKPLAAVAAAAAVIVILISPGFLFQASMKESGNMMPDNIAGDFEYYAADSAAGMEQQIENSSSHSYIPLFDAESFEEVYAIIPSEFSSLVNEDEFEEWKLTVKAENGMAMMQFVEHFGISEEAFDTANKEYNKTNYIDIKKNNNYFDREIIYSFDRELIDSFYSK